MSEEDGRVVSNFICQALRGNDLTIYGSGLQTRSFCYVDDLIAAFMAVLKRSGDNTGPFNIGNPTEFTIKQLADLVVELSDSNPKIVFKDLPEDDPKQRKPDITFVTKTTGWMPNTDLRTGIQKTIEFFREKISEASKTQ
jgi:UDP-glucuronate decarboxylase